MNPLVAALASNPTIVNAAHTAVKELKPVLVKAMRRPRGLLALGAAGSAASLTAIFAAGIAVGWFTAPRTGAQLRVITRASVKTWVTWATSLIKHEEDSPVNGSVGDLEPSEVVAGNDPPAQQANETGDASSATAN